MPLIPSLIAHHSYKPTATDEFGARPITYSWANPSSLAYLQREGRSWLSCASATIASPEAGAAVCVSAQTPDPGHRQDLRFPRSPSGRSEFLHHHGENGRMTTGALNGREHAAAGALPGEQSLLNAARGAANA